MSNTDKADELKQIFADICDDYNKDVWTVRFEMRMVDRRRQVEALIKSEKQKILQALGDELREYHEQFPDADYYDISGYIAGVINRPKGKELKNDHR